MGKCLKISEVIEFLNDNDGERFRCSFNARVLIKDGYGEINWEDADVDEHLILDEECLFSYTFKMINDAIRYEEAIKLWVKGVMIEVETIIDGESVVSVFDEDSVLSIDKIEITDGVWRVSE